MGNGVQCAACAHTSKLALSTRREMINYTYVQRVIPLCFEHIKSLLQVHVGDARERKNWGRERNFHQFIANAVMVTLPWIISFMWTISCIFSFIWRHLVMRQRSCRPYTHSNRCYRKNFLYSFLFFSLLKINFVTHEMTKLLISYMHLVAPYNIQIDAIFKNKQNKPNVRLCT